jgi:hypothetical protein
MSQGHSNEHHGAAGGLKHMASEEHHVAREARKVDSTIYMAEALSSGDPKRIERYFLRKFAYKLFGKFMGKTINRIR